MVTDKEITELFYLKSDKTIAHYLGIDEERVARLRPKPPAAKEEPKRLPEPLEAEMAKPLVPHSELVPDLCPTCGAPVSNRLMVTHIQALVAAYYQIPVRAMVSKQQRRDYAYPRQVAMYLTAELTPKSLPDIGNRFGGRDHTTVIHAIKAVQRRMLADPEIEADVKAIRERLAGERFPQGDNAHKPAEVDRIAT